MHISYFTLLLLCLYAAKFETILVFVLSLKALSFGG